MMDAGTRTSLAGPGSGSAVATTVDEPLTGVGSAPSHHGELLQGVFVSGGRVRRGLTTLPCSVFMSRARVHLSRREPELRITPSWRTKALAAAHGTLRALGLSGYGGTVEVHSDVRVGLGLGSSSSDVTATILGVLAATGRTLTAERIAHIAVSAEAATDPLVFDRMVLFAQREGHVIEDFGRPMVPLEVVGFDSGLGEVDTLAMPAPRYRADEIEAFRVLRGALRAACRDGDAAALGAIATRSARINQRLLPVPRFDRLLEIARESGATGLQIAHSGSVAGLLYRPGSPTLESDVALGVRRLTQLRIRDTWRYTSA
jgi:uncharacterized protein involved in propanediol utilization